MQFKKFFMESINYNLADFYQKWDQALSNSEDEVKQRVTAFIHKDAI